MNIESTGPNDLTPAQGDGVAKMDLTEGVVADSRFSVRRVLLLVMPLGLLILGVLGGKFWAESTAERQSSLDSVERTIGIGKPIQNRLADRFGDANGDLVAEPPKNPKDFLDPEVLTFSYIPSERAKDEKKVWQKWCDDLAKATGKRVEYLPIAKVDDQLKALKKGHLHVAGLNTGAVPTAVDDCGFVPICTLGLDDNSFGYSMLLIVPAKSPIRDPKELRGQTIAFKDAASNSGFKAPIVALLNEFGLRPTRDYDWFFTYEHENAIRMVARGKCAAAAVASDRLAALINSGEIKEADVRIIYKSPSFPPAAIGCVYNLKPELVAKIKSALMACNWKEAGLTERLGGGGATRFVPVTYRQAFAPVRQIDDTMGVRHQAN
ncbi:MAG: phosphate/phosphite/phosphonate ABC transporter substrate-binding protein [Thermoguttaceae bacterium]